MQVDEGSSKFLQWFKSVGGILNDTVGIIDFPGMSRGAIALQDIKKDTVLFTIPRKALLSTKTSSLRRLLGEEDWTALGNGWQLLILSMMWEESKGKESYWYGYLEDLPESFDTLMFWSDEELDALQGSTIRDKIGKADAEKDYYERILPVIQRRSDIFDPSHLQKHFGIERYHINGNRILSRSFQVEEWNGSAEDNEQEQNAGDHDISMQSDPDPQNAHDEPNNDEEGDVNSGHGDVMENEDSDQDESEGLEDIAMVPMADILNARYGCNNARLFYEKDHLQMVATQAIKSGEQIWNTYGDLPNAELLRRYGHVDVIPIEKEPKMQSGHQPPIIFPFENPADEVEIRADLVLPVCLPDAHDSEKTDKIDVWLQLGGEDIFAIDKDELLPKPMLSMIRYLSLRKEEAQEVVEKEKLPKGKINIESLQKAIGILERRLKQYQSSVEEDELFLSRFEGLPNRLYFATFVRLGEKRLLEQALKTAKSVIQQEQTSAKKELKRGRNDEGTQSRKKMKR